MLLSKTAQVRWNGISRKHYEDLGYEWTKKGDEFVVKVEELTPSSTSRVNVQCDECGEIISLKWEDYQKRLKEDNKYYCRNCARKTYGEVKLQSTILKQTKTFESWCIINNKLELLIRWSDKNNKKPNEIAYGSGKSFYFKCPKGIHNDTLIKINTLTSGMIKEVECKFCGSFAQYLLDEYGDNAIELYWDYQKNKLNPWEIAKSSHSYIWIKCQEKDYHGSYKIMCGDFYTGRRCGYCGNLKVHPLDSLEKILKDKDLLHLWSNKNKESPFEYSPSSHEEVYWKCFNSKHDEYKRSIKESSRFEFRCPECSEEDKMERMYSLCGEKNYNYNPELTDDEREKGRYKLYGESHKKWRNQVFERDEYTCQCCKKHGGKLNAHHLDGWNWAKDKRYDIKNGITLCKECHKKFHHIYGIKNNTKQQYIDFIRAS